MRTWIVLSFTFSLCKYYKIKFGDDLLYITGSDGNYKKLEDNEYYFSTIAFPGEIINGNNVTIPAEKYDCELWLRYENSSDYIKYEDFKNIVSTYNSKTWNFTKENKVVGYYFIVKNMTESFKSKYSSSSSSFSTIVINNAENIAESGRIYNFAYIQVFINGVLQNAPGLDSYANFITKEEIATHDMSTYNTYLQRHCYSISYYIG